MTRKDIIARIREIEARTGLSPVKGLSRAVKAVLQDDLDHLMYVVEVAAHEENDRRKAAQMTVNVRVTTDAPGVWEIVDADPKTWDVTGGYRLLKAVDAKARLYTWEIKSRTIVRHVNDLNRANRAVRYVVTSTYHPEIRDDLYGVKDTFTGEQIMSDIWAYETCVKIAVQHNDGWREDVAQGRATDVVWPTVDHDLVTV